MTLEWTPWREVRAAELPAALRWLWRACADASRCADVMRSLAANVIAVFPACGGGSAEESEELVDGLAERIPSRAFTVLLRAGRASIEVRGAMRRAARSRAILMERVRICGDRAEIPRFLGLIRPLLVADLTTHCLWSGDCSEDDEDVLSFAGLADHLIVDSARFRDPARGLARRREAAASAARVTDLNWLRLRPWRLALAEAFERFDGGGATAAEIRHGPRARAQAIILGEWIRERTLADVRLDCTEEGDGIQGLELRRGGSVVHIAPSKTGLEVRVTTRELCHLPFVLPVRPRSPLDLLAAAIDSV
ncbi:MAG: hypothetical protein Fur0037_01630 [Planctomycetota bacterium]